MIIEGNGNLFLDEKDLWPEGKFVTAHIIVRTKFLKQHRQLVKRWIEAHVKITDWINHHPAEAKEVINNEIKKITGKALPLKVLDDAFMRTSITYDPIKSSLISSAEKAYEAGFLGKQRPDLSSIYDLSLLNEVLKETNHDPLHP